MATASSVIPFDLFRAIIQDKPKRAIESFATNGATKVFQLDNYPVLNTKPITISKPDYTLDAESGQLIYSTPPSNGTLEADYYHAQLSDAEIELCLNNALSIHASGYTWDSIPQEELTPVQVLAASSALYMLAAKWATAIHIKVDGVETYENGVATQYFQLAKQMEQSYNSGNFALIDVRTVTRRDVLTGVKIEVMDGDKA